MNDDIKPELPSSPCARCANDAWHVRPSCHHCGLWQPWGDAAVAKIRAQRVAKQRSEEEKEELDWDGWRADPISHAPPLALRWRILRGLHLLRCRPERAALAAIGALALTSLAAWGVVSNVPRSTPRAETRATAKCADGTWSYAENRAGACAGHGGVKVFYSGR